MFQIAILYFLITALVILGAISMFFIKKPALQKIMTLVMVVLSLCIGILNFTSLPSNVILNKAIAIIIAIIPILSIALLYYKKINWLIFKLIVLASNVAGAIYFIFY